MAGDNSTDRAKKDLYLAYRDKLRPALARLEKAKAEVSAIYADAKRDKIVKKAFVVGDKLLSQKKKIEEGVMNDMALVLWVGDAVGHEIAKQGDLFAYLSDAQGGSAISPEAEGKQAFRDGSAAKPPYPPGTENYDQWMAGFYSEQDKKVQDFKPLKRGRPAKDEPPADDEMAWPDDQENDPARPLQ